MTASPSTPVLDDPTRTAALDALERLDAALGRLEVELAEHLRHRRAQAVRLETWSGRHREDFEADTAPVLVALGPEALGGLRRVVAGQRHELATRPSG